MKRMIALLFMLSLTGCGIKTHSWWKEPEIAVLADDGDWEAIQGSLRSCFERVVRTPQVETTYRVKRVSEEDFERYTKYRYIILAATLGSRGRAGNLLAGLLANPEVRREVEEGRQNLFKREDPWAKDQLMVVLAANNITELREVIEANSPDLYRMFDEDVLRKMEAEIFHRREQKDLEKRLMGTYGWSLRVHRDYFIAQELPGEGMIWWRRTNPERWLFVRWIDNADESVLNEAWVVGERNRVGERYYGGDRLIGTYLFSTDGTFLGRPARITTGLWENQEKVAGGPFRNYAFYDEPTGRLFMIDIAVYAPGRDKIPFMRRLDIIAHTFSTLFDK